MLAIKEVEVAVYSILWNVIIIKMIILLVKYEYICAQQTMLSVNTKLCRVSICTSCSYRMGKVSLWRKYLGQFLSVLSWWSQKTYDLFSVEFVESLQSQSLRTRLGRSKLRKGLHMCNIHYTSHVSSRSQKQKGMGANSSAGLSGRAVMNHCLSALRSCFVFVLPAPKQKGKSFWENVM